MYLPKVSHCNIFFAYEVLLSAILVHQLQRLKLLVCGCQYFYVLCVYAPEATNNYFSETKPE